MDITSNIVLAMIVSGGLAGLAGTAEILGVQHRLREFFSPGYGYDAVAVALLGSLDPFGVVLASLFFGALRSGAGLMERAAGISINVIYVVQALAVLFVISVAVFRYRLTRSQSTRREETR
jgi:simple sugar transport system permease protein